MAYSDRDFSDYVASLCACSGFPEAFSLFESQAFKLGLDGVLYTFIPRIVIDNQFAVKPVYEVSKNYAPAYLNHYAEARFDKADPLIKAVESGATNPISWWGPICQDYMDKCDSSYEVIASSRGYGINNGVTLPLLCSSKGIAGASFITGEEKHFDLLMSENLRWLELCSKLFHSFVTNDTEFNGRFARPLLSGLSNTELQLLSGLARGESMAAIAADINRSVKYLEQVMLNLRRKMSGVGRDDPPLINRNQLLYYAGLLNILEPSRVLGDVSHLPS